MATKWTLSIIAGISVLILIASQSLDWYHDLIELNWQFKYVVPGIFIMSIIFGTILGWGQSSVGNTFSDTLRGNVIGGMIIGLMPSLFIAILMSMGQVPTGTPLVFGSLNTLFITTWMSAVPFGLSVGLLFFITYVTSFFTIFIPNW